MQKDRFPYAVGLVLGIIVLVVVAQAILPERIPPPAPPTPPAQQATCIGTPIKVSYAYTGGYIQDHACLPQCADNKPRYVLYTNGEATQCETPPGCNDTGEDTGVTCVLPAQSVTSK